MIPRILWPLAAVPFLLLAACSREPAPKPSAPVTTHRLVGNDVSVYQAGDLWAFRRNNWSLYGWIQALRATDASRNGEPTPKDSSVVLVYFDSHSDLHPSPVCGEPDRFRAGDMDAAAGYVDRLSVASFRLAALHYGFVREIYWVQPDITPYQGPEESIRFRTIERNGFILPDATRLAGRAELESLGVRACQGLPVPRSADLAAAYGALPEHWVDGSFILHCLNLEQLTAKIHAGVFRDRRVLVDLDLDYFGTEGTMRGYGYLGFFPRSHVAVGLLGGILPVFGMSPSALEARAAQVLGAIRELRAIGITMCESPDHSHRDTLPRLVQFFRRELGTLMPPSATPPDVSLVTAAGRTALSSTCPSPIDLAGADSLTLELRWATPPSDSSEISLYFDPNGSRDRRVMRTVLPPGSATARLRIFPSAATDPPKQLPRVEQDRWLGVGWDCDVRDAGTGVLLFTAAFVLDDGTTRLVKVLRELRSKGAYGGALERPSTAMLSDEPSHYLDLPPSRVIEEGRSAGLPPVVIHRILLANPRTQIWQCQNLRRFRDGFGTVRETAPNTRP